MLHSEAVSLRGKKSEVCMSWNSYEKGKSCVEPTGVGMSFLHSVMFEIKNAGSGGESKKESLHVKISTDTQTL